MELDGLIAAVVGVVVATIAALAIFGMIVANERSATLSDRRRRGRGSGQGV
jgi:hypothetical protein